MKSKLQYNAVAPDRTFSDRIKRVITLLTLGVLLLISVHMRVTSATGTWIPDPVQRDAGEYFMYAYNLKFHHVYSRDMAGLYEPGIAPVPDAVRSPGYPLFLSLFINGPADDRTIKTITFAQAILSSITVVLCFFLFNSFLPLAWTTAATFLTGISPHLITANSYLLSETLFAFFLVLLAWFISHFSMRRRAWQAAIAGCLVALASLIRPGLQYFAVLFALFLLFQFGRDRGAKLSGMVILGFALCLAPWLVRNANTIGSTSDKTLMINFLHHGLYPDFTYEETPTSFGVPYRFDPRSAEISRTLSTVLQEIQRRFQEEPARHLRWFLIGKPAVFWSWDMVQGAGGPFVYLPSHSPYFNDGLFKLSYNFMRLLHGPIVLLAFCGLLVAWLPLTRIGVDETPLVIARVLSLLLIYYTVIHMVGAPFPRYAVPLRPFLYGMALFPLYVAGLFLRKRLS